MIFPARNLHGPCGDVPIVIFDDTRGYSIKYPIQYPTINKYEPFFTSINH